MDINKLRALQQKAQEEINEVNSRGNKGNGLPMVYPHNNGTFRIKLLFDEKSGLLQRKLIRHNSGNKKLPCLSMYGEDCPVCAKVAEIQDSQGRESGVFSKYGYNTKCICHAVLMNDDDNAVNSDRQDKLKIGDAFIMMYPVSLYNKINELIVKSGEHITSLLATNEGKTIEISRKQNGNGPIEYNASIYAFGDEKVRNTEEEFNELLESLPSLNEEMVPSSPTEDIRNSIKALVETIDAEFVSGKVINPNNQESVNQQNQSKNENNGASIADAMNPPVEDSKPEEQHNEPAPSTSSNSGMNITMGNNAESDRPECFGKHSDTEKKCMLCPAEVDCMMVQ